jgi:hypothetical protein
LIACTALYFWATSRGIVPHLSFEKSRPALGRALAGVFAIAFLYFFRGFAGPDRVIRRRLRHVASTLGLDLTMRANGMVSDWVWARFTTADALVTSRLGGRCWSLASAADPSMLLVLNHIPKVDGLSLRVGGDKQREILSVMLFRQVGERARELSTAQAERLAAAGFTIDRIPDGLFVHEIKRCGPRPGQRAIDRANPDRLVELWGLCAGSPAALHPPP